MRAEVNLILSGWDSCDVYTIITGRGILRILLAVFVTCLAREKEPKKNWKREREKEKTNKIILQSLALYN